MFPFPKHGNFTRARRHVLGPLKIYGIADMLTAIMALKVALAAKHNRKSLVSALKKEFRCPEHIF